MLNSNPWKTDTQFTTWYAYYVSRKRELNLEDKLKTIRKKLNVKA